MSATPALSVYTADLSQTTTPLVPIVNCTIINAKNLTLSSKGNPSCYKARDSEDHSLRGQALLKGGAIDPR